MFAGPADCPAIRNDVQRSAPNVRNGFGDTNRAMDGLADKPIILWQHAQRAELPKWAYLCCIVVKDVAIVCLADHQSLAHEKLMIAFVAIA